MKIDYAKTKEKFDMAGYAQSKVARAIGVHKAIFYRVLSGEYPFMGSKSAHKVVSKLRDLGVLVEDPEDQEAA